MTDVLVDTSVLIKWFHADGEAELSQARTLRKAHEDGRIDAHILDLGVYEVGNVLVRSLRWPAGEVAEQLDDLLAVVGAPLAMTQPWLRVAADMAHTHTLSYYDACWAAAAAGLTVPLVSADRRLIGSGLAESLTDVVARLRL
ncbi:MAG TPA: type II toxin-antitoxin system VapC family toxin [Jatrophihabitantaceae bacterium]